MRIHVRETVLAALPTLSSVYMACIVPSYALQEDYENSVRDASKISAFLFRKGTACESINSRLL